MSANPLVNVLDVMECGSVFMAGIAACSHKPYPRPPDQTSGIPGAGEGQEKVYLPRTLTPKASRYSTIP